MIKRNEINKKLLQKCMVCHYGGQHIFPDCLYVDPRIDCYYFDDKNDDPRDENYNCVEYIHEDTYQQLHNLDKNNDPIDENYDCEAYIYEDIYKKLHNLV